jgi:hypothetical protein
MTRDRPAQRPARGTHLRVHVAMPQTFKRTAANCSHASANSTEGCRARARARPAGVAPSSARNLTIGGCRIDGGWRYRDGVALLGPRREAAGGARRCRAREVAEPRARASSGGSWSSTCVGIPTCAGALRRLTTGEPLNWLRLYASATTLAGRVSRQGWLVHGTTGFEPGATSRGARGSQLLRWTPLSSSGWCWDGLAVMAVCLLGSGGRRAMATTGWSL